MITIEIKDNHKKIGGKKLFKIFEKARNLKFIQNRF